MPKTYSSSEVGIKSFYSFPEVLLNAALLVEYSSHELVFLKKIAEYSRLCASSGLALKPPHKVLVFFDTFPVTFFSI